MTTVSVSFAVVSSFVASPLHFPFSRHLSVTKLSPQIPRVSWQRKQLGFSLLAAAVSESPSEATYDPDLRLVFELATDSELYELEQILFGPSYFSPLLKSIPNKGGADRLMIGQDIEVRDGFIEALESRFLFLAADARSTLSEASGIFPGLWENSEVSEVKGSLELGLSKWKVELLAALQVGATEVQSMILKGGGMITFAKVYQLFAKKLSGKVFLEAANYQMRREMLKKGGQLAAINLESRAALLAAKHGFTGAASRYLGLKTAMQLLGPMMWGTLLADLVIQMLETDYARILRAIYAFAQIRITRTYRLPCK